MPLITVPRTEIPAAVELAAGSLDLGEPADVVPDGEHRTVGPSAQDQRIGDGEDRGGVDDDQVVNLAELGDHQSELPLLEHAAGVRDRRARGEQVECAPLDGDDQIRGRRARR